MEQGLVKRETLVAIGNSIRTKNGTQDTYTPGEMPAAIEAIKSGAENQPLNVTTNGTYNAPEGVGYSPVVVNVPQSGAPTDEELDFSGINGNSMFKGGNWDWFINKYGNRMKMNGIVNETSSMFESSKLEYIPFEINVQEDSFNLSQDMFRNCYYLKELPKFSGVATKVMSRIFQRCKSIKEFPADIENWFGDWSKLDGATDRWDGSNEAIIRECYSLRKLPMSLLKHGNPYATYFALDFGNDYCLDEILDLPNPYYKAEITGYGQGVICQRNFRIKDFTFAPTMTNGEPNNPKWKNQFLDLAWAGFSDHSLTQHGMPAETEIKDDASYQALKDNPDSWTRKPEYSRYNYASAVRTINSLPDTSAYLASTSGENTIKFRSGAGSKTDAGGIGKLTSEEIAVAAAKGWTVTFD